MADQVLEKANLYFDELNKLKLLKPQYSQASSDLLEKIRLLISKNDDLETFKRDIELKFAELCQLLEEQMLKAAAARSAVTNYNVQRKRKHELLRSSISRKQSILEKLTIEIKTLEEEEERQRTALLRLTEDLNFESI
ncbi:hypothetical protein M514_10715 [Trichuris suis]|uniref:Uncharacterized protein n=1 Tax=Trichuris suis TaxID=68888 RepID=A0A085LTW9_9BILA|nr:hypothetical protein M513_10715 [Trichuris suis]KFD62447.1 hypothetical protein M514_10715 [Trichuris suis]